MDTSKSSGAGIRVAVLADDLTGAGDTVVQFVEQGWAGFLQRGVEPPRMTAAAAVARALNTRALPAGKAAAVTAEAVRGQREGGATRIYLKIDSTMRGSVAAQLQGGLGAWREAHPDAFVVLCPAYPAMGRTMRDGRLWVHGTALEDSPAGTDPVTPVRSSRFAELVPGCGIVPAQADVAALTPELQRAAAEHDVVVVEAAQTAHLEALAGAVAALGARALPAGSAGLALPLARAWHPGHGAPRAAFRPQAREGIVLVVVTSANEVSRRQVEAAQAAYGARLVRAMAALADLADPAAARRWAETVAIPAAAQVVVLGAPSERTVAAGRVEGGRLVAAGMGAAAAALLARCAVGTLVLVGGDGAEATLDTLDVAMLAVQGMLLEGVPCSCVSGGAHDGLQVVTKAGGFGTDATLTILLDAVLAAKETT